MMNAILFIGFCLQKQFLEKFKILLINVNYYFSPATIRIPDFLLF